MVKKDFPQVTLIENSQNRGFAAANNQGIDISKGRYVLLLNSDTVVLDNAIAKTVAFADSHPKAAIVGCRVLNPDQTLQPTCFMFPSILNMLLSSTYLYKIFPKSKFFGREQMTWWDRSDVREVDVVTGCFMLIRRKAIQQVGTMDEQFFMYGEETDWCYRIKLAGWKVMFTPVCEIIHLGGQSSRQKRSKMILQLRGSILLFMKKHNSFLTYALACLLVALFFFLRVPYWLIRAMFSRHNKSDDILIARAYLAGACKALLGAESLC
ncbi:MAG: glycosyltransferase family 2 protein [Candidatus Hermodarchaeia archaeon]